MIFRLPDHEIVFPDPALAEPDGLLAIGGDLRPERLILAYENGIFPWFSDDQPILWYAPHERCVIFPDRIRVSTSMRRLMSSGHFRISFDEDFSAVISRCASIPRPGQDGTWITTGMQEAYCRLHELGIAHSVEVWQGEQLAGGLYGVKINGVFCGESMFSEQSNASKSALIWLAAQPGVDLIDCQIANPHLMSLGAEMLGSAAYLERLRRPASTR